MAKQFKHTIAHNYFNCIDSSVKAYLLGFFVADGTLELNQCNHYSLRVVQKLEDSAIIKLFQSEISPNSKLEVCRGKYNRISIVSQPIGQALTQLGFPVRKTYTEHGLPNIDSKYMADFVRGYFDGDGTANAYLINNKVIRQVRMVGNSVQFLTELKGYLNAIGIDCTLRSYRKGDSGSRYTYLSIRNTYKEWYNFLYPGITTFQRKQY